MAENVKAGSDVEAYCTTCKTMKWHVVVAVVDGRPAKVECDGCHRQHLYRPVPPGTARRPRRTRAEEGPPPAELHARLAGREARPYSPEVAFSVDEVIQHPAFGVGVVIAVPEAQRMDVDFQGGRKRLVHNRAAPAAPRLTRPVRRDDDERWGPTDTPPK